MAGHFSVSGGSGATQTLVVDITSGPQFQMLLAGLKSLSSSGPGVTESIFVYTPGSLGTPTGTLRAGRTPWVKAAPDAINIENGTPLTAGQSITLGHKAQGIVLTGTTAARIVGHPGNSHGSSELLMGNMGNDTIVGGGGSGTIISGTGANRINTQNGDFVISSAGTDTIKTGTGIADIEAYGSATVKAGAGVTIFKDGFGTAGALTVPGGGHFKVVANALGFTEAISGQGSDTFIAGQASTAYFVDSGWGGVTFKITFGDFGVTLIQGFDSNTRGGGKILGDTASVLGGPASGAGTVIAGSTYFDIGGTKVIFEGSTHITYSNGSFTGF